MTQQTMLVVSSSGYCYGDGSDVGYGHGSGSLSTALSMRHRALIEEEQK